MAIVPPNNGFTEVVNYTTTYYIRNYTVSGGSDRKYRKPILPKQACRRLWFGINRIVKWVETAWILQDVGVDSIPLSWKPMFGFPVPQQISEFPQPQKIGKSRRARLCSSSRSLMPY